MYGGLHAPSPLRRHRSIDSEAILAAGEGSAEDDLLVVRFAEVAWNTPDNLLNPTRGILLRGRIDDANTALLSDMSFVELVGGAVHGASPETRALGVSAGTRWGRG
jgi:outer membrane translocation and assembly module TamA